MTSEVQTPHDANDVPVWAPRVSQRAIRRLYESEASGLLDEEIVDDVGVSLLLRCESILQIAQAVVDGQVGCPRCEGSGKRTTFPREGEAPLLCPVCGWTMTWDAYWRTFKGQQLNAGGAASFFRDYVEAYPRSRSYQEKVIAIDRLIHAFHHNVSGIPCRAACVNLIQGKLSTVIQFLDELSSGEPGSDSTRTRNEWRHIVGAIRDRNASGTADTSAGSEPRAP